MRINEFSSREITFLMSDVTLHPSVPSARYEVEPLVDLVLDTRQQQVALEECQIQQAELVECARYTK